MVAEGGQSHLGIGDRAEFLFPWQALPDTLVTSSAHHPAVFLVLYERGQTLYDADSKWIASSRRLRGGR